MKVLVVHEVDYVNKPFFEFQEFAEGLSVRGHQVSVLHVQEFEKNKAKRLPSILKIPGLEIPNSEIMLFSTELVVRGISTRLLAVCEHTLMLLRIIVSHRPDVILSYSVPTSGVSAALLGKLFGVPVVHRSIDVSHLLRSKILSSAVRLSEMLTFKLSTKVSTHNSALRNYIQKTSSSRALVSIEYPPVYPVDVRQRSQVGMLERELRLIFIGTLAHFTDLETVLLSMSSSASRRRVHLRIVGSGLKDRELKRISEELGLTDRVEFRGWKDRVAFAEELSWADVGIVPFKQNLLTDCALPHKAIEYLSYGIPAVSARLKGAESVLGDIDGMHFVNSSAEIIEYCVNLARDQKLTIVDRNLVRERFGRTSAIASMEEMLLDVIKE